jgi:23S rRNA (uridine2552-2'-O)-methyltransferase
MPKPYQPNDKWSQKAAAEGYRARSVYKLMELDERQKLLQPGMTVLDIGAAPGSWLQYAAEVVGPTGKVIGIDLTPIAPIAENVFTYEQDLMDIPGVRKIVESHGVQQVDLVLSDAAPNTSGVADIDQWRSVELTRSIMDTAIAMLKPGGKAVAKIFRGADFDEFVNTLKKQFRSMKIVHVQATRDRSREVYIVVRK